MISVTPSMLLGSVLGLVLGSGVLLVLLAGMGSHLPRRSRRRQGSLSTLIARSGVRRMTATSVVMGSIVMTIVGGLLALVVTSVPSVALLGSIGGATLPILLLRRAARRRMNALRAAWPDAIDTVISGVRAGLPLTESLAALGHRGPQALRVPFADFADDLRIVATLDEALDRLRMRLADPVADRVIAVLRIAREVGGTDLGRVLRDLASLLRDDARARGEIEARQSWTVASARVAVAAPWVTLALLCTRPQAASAYRSAAGIVIVCGALLASLVAYRLMLRIARLPREPRFLA